MNMRIVTLLAAIGAGAVMTASAPATAEPFSIQGFSGGPAGQDALPGVRLNSDGTVSPQANCVERSGSSVFHRPQLHGTTVQTCSFGNFSFTTTQNNSPFKPTMHNQFGHRPLPGWGAWQP